MIGILMTLLGGVIGWRVAKKRGGNRLDIAQYVAAYGLAFAILGLFVGVIFDRLV